MRYFIISIIAPFIFFTQCVNQKNQDKILELPSNALIEEVLTSVILKDSLFNGHLGNRQLLIPNIYFMQKWDKDSHNTPPPPPPDSHSYKISHGYSFDEAFTYFNSLNKLELRQRDSIFIVRQVDTTINHIISKNISELFKKEKNDKYWLSMPIFSYDKRTVIITYSEEFYFGYRTVLKKVDEKWVKVDHELTWQF
jgi:hypothetical protein